MIRQCVVKEGGGGVSRREKREMRGREEEGERKKREIEMGNGGEKRVIKRKSE